MPTALAYGNLPPPLPPHGAQLPHATSALPMTTKGLQTVQQHDWQGHVHAVLWKHFEVYHKVFQGSMLFWWVLKMVNLEWRDFPTLENFVDEKGLNMICFNYICGQCNFLPCHLKKGHVDKEWNPRRVGREPVLSPQAGKKYTLQAGVTTGQKQQKV